MQPVLSSLIENLLLFLREHEALALASTVFLEEAGLPLPFPGDAIILYAGFLVQDGRVNVFLMFFILELSTIAGSSILYAIGDYGGRPILARYGKYFGLDENRLARLEKWLSLHEGIAIVLGRLIPGLRLATSLVCGAFEIPYKAFLPFMALGSTIYVLIWFVLGITLGQDALRLGRELERLHISRIVFLAVIVLFVFLFLLGHYRSSKSTR